MSAAGSSGSGSVRNSPKDAQVMISLLKELGVTDYEPKVVDQMLDFTYKYVSTVLEEAKVLSSHAKKRTIDNDDIRLAVNFLCDRTFTNPPPREVLMEAATSRNAQPLPPIKNNTGARIPPERYTLTSHNFRCKLKPKPPAKNIIQTAQSAPLNRGHK